MAEAKIHPPSPERIAEARRSGLAPRAPLVGLVAAILALFLWGRLLVSRVLAQLEALFRGALAQAARGAPPGEAWELVKPVAFSLAELLGAVFLCLVAASIVAQGPHFAWPKRPRRPFTRARKSRTASLLAALLVPLVAVSLLPRALWIEPQQVGDVLLSALGRLSALLLVLALIDVAFARTRFLRALWLTRREQRDAQREVHGAPELRAARERARVAWSRREAP
jgi:flagellar biosynthesis protein FlhB